MYVVQSSLQTDSPIMLLNQHIGYDEKDGYGCSGAEFQRELLELDNMGFKRIQVWINSPGGIVMDGYLIYNAILKTKTPVDTLCVGMAASIAAVIFQAGRKRIMADYGRLMFHAPSGSDDKVFINNIRQTLVTMIASRSGKSESDIDAMMDKVTWISPDDALAAGLCDSIEQSSEQNMKYARNLWESANSIINSVLKIENKNMETTVAKVSLSLIANYLGLNSEATENSILVEVKNRINAETLEKEKAKGEAKIVQTALDKRNSEYEALNTKYEAKEKELTDVKNQIESDKKESEKKVKEAELSAAKVKAETMVKNHAKAGRIKTESVDKWVAKATEDFDGVDNLLKDLPVNKDAVHIDTETSNDPSKAPLSAALMMAQIQNNLKKSKA
jgi:ATP-dependent Clp endopeptidase proteolytic subunit ClpP